MQGYSFLEMADMHFLYSNANGTVPEARQYYEEAFADPCSL